MKKLLLIAVMAPLLVMGQQIEPTVYQRARVIMPASPEASRIAALEREVADLKAELAIIRLTIGVQNEILSRLVEKQKDSAK